MAYNKNRKPTDGQIRRYTSMAKTINMKEIAKLSGVSIATVSRVINQNGRFSKETEDRVRKIIEENNYSLDNSSKGIWKNKNSNIGIIVPDITNPHFSALILQIQMALFYGGYSTIIFNTNESEVLEKKHVEILRAKNVAGVMIISGNRYHEALRKYPVVYVDRPHVGEDDNAVIIESDNESGGYMAANEILGAGCKNIVFLMSRGTDVNQISRYNGCLRALMEKGIPERPEYIKNNENVSIYSGKASITSLIQSGLEFDGIVATTDTLAAGAYLALREYGIQVPKQVKIVGFDDCIIADICGVGITSIRQDVAGMASVAVDMLIRQINGEKIPTTKRQMRVTLSRRASTDMGASEKN